MKNYLQVNRALAAKKNFNFNCLQGSSSLKRVGLVLVMCLIALPQLWGYTAKFRCVPALAYGNNWAENKTLNVGLHSNSSDENHWHEQLMKWNGLMYEKNGNLYKIYEAEVTTLNQDGARYVRFKLYNPGSSSATETPTYNSWQNASYWSGKMYVDSWDYGFSYKTWDISSGTTIVWDAGRMNWGGDGHTPQIYIYKDNYNEGQDLTKIGGSQQYYKTFGSTWGGYGGLIFRGHDNFDNGQSTNINTDVSSSTNIVLFTHSSNGSGSGSYTDGKADWQKISPAYKGTSGTTIYFDNTVTNWSNVYFKYGTPYFNRYETVTNAVPGTDGKLLYITLSQDIYYGQFMFADGYGYTNYYPIDDSNCSHYTALQADHISTAKTYIPTANAQKGATTVLSGYERTVTISSYSHGTVTVSYTDAGNTARSKTSGNFNVQQACVITATAVADEGYRLTGLTIGGDTHSSGDTYAVRANTTVTATFTANTYNVRFNANDANYVGTASGSMSNQSHTYGSSKALTSNGFSLANHEFLGWATTPTGAVVYDDGETVSNLSSTQGATVDLYAKWGVLRGTVYKFEVSSSKTSGNVCSSNTEVPQTTEDQLSVLEGGTLTANSGSSFDQLTFSSGAYRFTGGNNGCLTLTLSDSIRKGDVIKFVNKAASGNKVFFRHTSKSTSTNEVTLDGNGSSTAQYVEIPDAFSQKKVIYIVRNSSNTALLQSVEIIRPYTITLDANTNGGKIGGENTASFKTAGTKYFPHAVRDDYIFKGWFVASSGGEPVSEPYIPTANTTLYAQYGTCSSAYGTAYKFEAKSGMADNSSLPAFDLLEFNSTNYLATEVSGGRLYGYNENSKFQISSGGFKLTDNAKSYFKIDLDCAIAEGDIIDYIITGQNGTLYKEPSKSKDADLLVTLTKTSNSTTHGRYQVPSGSSLIGKDVMYLFPGSTNAIVYYFEIIRPYKITLDENGGSSLNDIFGFSGDKVVLPHTFKASKRFKGWYTETSGGTKRNNYYTISGSETVHAQWEAIPTSGDMFTLTMESSMAPASAVTIPANDSIDLLKYATVYGGSSVVGNTNTSSAKGSIAASTSKLTFNGAQYQGLHIHLDFPILEGDTIITTTETKALVYTNNATRSTDNTFTLGTNQKLVVDGSSILKNQSQFWIWQGSSSGGVFSSLKIKRPAKYTITYAKGSADGASGSLAAGTKIHNANYTISSTDDAFTRSGFTYDGWSTSEDGSTKDYDFNETYSTNADLTLYPHWVISCTTPTIEWSTEPADGVIGNMMTVSVTSNYPAGVALSAGNSKATLSSRSVVGSTVSYTLTYAAAGDVTISASVTGDGTTYCADEVAEDDVAITVSKKTPAQYSVSGTASICSGDDATITLADSEDGVSYQLYKGASTEGDAVDGTGDALEWTVDEEGTYTVKAVASDTYSARDMSGSAVISFYDAVSIDDDPTASVNANVDEATALSGLALSSGTFNNVAYQWYTCDDAEKNNPETIDPSDNATADDATLSITPASVGVTYYYCEVSDECGNEDESAVVTVTAKNAISPTLSYDSYSVLVGSTLTATLDKDGSDGSVTYTSSNDGIATVASDGTVTGVAAGTVTITATIAAADDYWGNSVTSSTITVSEPTPIITYTMDITSGNDWGTSDIDPDDDEDITSLSANNTHAAQIDGKTANGSKTAGCTTAKDGTARDNDIYVEFCFKVANGKKLTPSKVWLEVSNIGSSSDGNMTYDAILSDGTRSISGSVTPASDGTLTELKFTNADDSKYMMGNVTLRVYPYNNDGKHSGEGFRMGQYVKIWGEIATACTKPDKPAGLKVEAGTLTHNRATFSWDISGVPEHTDGYEVSITKVSDGSSVLDWTDEGVYSKGDSSLYDASDLRPATEYYFSVKAKGADGYCEYGDTARVQFTTNNAQITYVYNGATGGASPATATGGQVTLPNPTKTISTVNYDFDGWYVGSTKIGDGGDKYTLTDNVTAYAKWKRECTVGGGEPEVLFSQNFNSATSVAYATSTARAYTAASADMNIVGRTDSASQFTSITCMKGDNCGLGINSSSGGASENWAGKIGSSCTATNMGWSIVKTTNFAESAPTAIKVEMKAKFKYNSGGSNIGVQFAVGSGFSDGLTTSCPALNQCVAGFALPSNNTIKIAKYAVANGNTAINSGSSALTDDKEYTYTWVINNTASSLRYINPSGDSSTVAAGCWDLWVDDDLNLAGITQSTTGMSGTTMQNLYIGSPFKKQHKFVLDSIVVTDLTPGGGGGSGDGCFYVTYDGNGADSGYVQDPTAYYDAEYHRTVSVMYNSTLTGFSRNGYEFNNWNTKADGSGTRFTDDDSFTITKDTTLYAQWKMVISKDNTDFEGYDSPTEYKDVRVTNGATLTISDTMAVKNITVESGATLNIAANKDDAEKGVIFTVNSLSLEGGWTTINKKKVYNMPRVYINPESKLVKTNDTINFDISVDYYNYYPFALPFDVVLKTYPYTDRDIVDYANKDIAAASTYLTHYAIREYDGARRAAGFSSPWNYVYEGTTLKAGKGYILYAKTVGGKGIIRFPMVVDNKWTAGGEKGSIVINEETITKNEIAVTAYGWDEEKGQWKPGVTNNRKGWNLLGVPFMSCYNTGADMDTSIIIQGRLNYRTYKWEDSEIRYVTIPTYDFSDYIQANIADDDTVTTLLPGWCFFVQVEESGTLTFLAEDEAAGGYWPIYAPRRANAPMPTVKTGIRLSGAGASDKTTILVSDKYSAEEYEINADLEKMFGENSYTLATYSLMGETRLAYNAMSTTDIMNVIPIGYRAPADGEYTFSINPRYAESEAFERVNLIDYEEGIITDLLQYSYTFATERTQNDTRFALNVVKKQPEVTTDIEATDDEQSSASLKKVIINDKLFIIRDGAMYDATGKRVKGGK